MRGLKYRMAGLLGSGLVSALFKTTKVERIHPEHYLSFRARGEPVIFVFWHGVLLPMVHHHRDEGFVVLVSEHGDGEYITRIMERTGTSTARGSSTRGGVKGLKGLVRAARAGRDLALTPDGPRGPLGIFKPGALAVAQMTGLPVIPIAVGASAGWRLGSWDRFLIPKPFSTVKIEYLEPRTVERDADRAELEEIAGDIERALNQRTEALAPDGPGADDPSRRGTDEALAEVARDASAEAMDEATEGATQATTDESTDVRAS